MTLENTPIGQLREAARAWRQNDAKRPALWPFGAPNLSLHDRIDELIDEVERLRAATR